MDTGAADQEVHFSTDFVPVRDRAVYLREVFGRTIARLDLGTYEDRPLRWLALLHGFEGLSVISGHTDGNTCQRSQSLLTDGNDDFLFTTNLSGFSLAYQVGRECRLDTGAAVLLSSSDVGGQDFPASADFLTLRIPRRQSTGMAIQAEDALALPIPAKTEALRLLLDYVPAALKNRQLSSPELRRLFAAHVHDLVALALGATRDASEIARNRGLRAARLSAIKSDIMGGLDDEGLSVADIAKRRGVTPRYVQMLFESEGSTFTEFVLEQRLTRARRMLVGSRHDNWTIAAIAFEAGFGNLSYFNRAFRSRFGTTPSDARRADHSALGI